MLLIGDSVRGTEAPICHPNNLSRGACCLPRAYIHDIMKSLPSLVGPEDYYLFLLFHVTTLHEAAIMRLWNIKRDLMSLRKILKGLGAQAVFPSVLPVGVWGPRITRKMDQLNGCMVGATLKDLVSMISDTLLRDWVCWHQMGHIWADGSRVFWATKPDGLISRALN